MAHFVKFNIDELYDNRNTLQPGGPAAFGCSFTYGTGVKHKNTWPALLGVYNCGQPGTSNDRIVRLAIEYINTYSPKEIYVMWTMLSRREWVDEEGTTLRFKVDDKEGNIYRWQEAHVELSNNNFDNYCYKKNVILLQSFCEARNVKLYDMSVHSLNHTMFPFGSDNSHPGELWHESVFQHYKVKQVVAKSS